MRRKKRRKNAAREYNDEFWVIGWCCGKSMTFMAWGGDSHGCYVDCYDPLRAEMFATYKEARSYLSHDKDAKEYAKEVGGNFVKPMRCKKAVVVEPPGYRSRRRSRCERVKITEVR